MKILIINFSGRTKGGNGEQIANFIYKTLINEEVSIINVSSLNISGCKNCSYECLNNSICRYINDDTVQLYDQILASDLIIHIIPVYSDYPCSNYFVFRERSQCYFNEETYDIYVKINKKFIIIANSGYDNTIGVIRNDFSSIYNSNILNISSNKYNTKSVYGNLMEYAEVREEVSKFIKEQ